MNTDPTFRYEQVAQLFSRKIDKGVLAPGARPDGSGGQPAARHQRVDGACGPTRKLRGSWRPCLAAAHGLLCRLPASSRQTTGGQRHRSACVASLRAARYPHRRDDRQGHVFRRHALALRARPQSGTRHQHLHGPAGVSLAGRPRRTGRAAGNRASTLPPLHGGALALPSRSRMRSRASTVSISGAVATLLEHASNSTLVPLGCAVPDPALLQSHRLDLALARAARQQGARYNVYGSPRGACGCAAKSPGGHCASGMRCRRTTWS